LLFDNLSERLKSNLFTIIYRKLFLWTPNGWKQWIQAIPVGTAELREPPEHQQRKPKEEPSPKKCEKEAGEEEETQNNIPQTMIQDGSLQVLNHKFTQQLKCCAYHIHDWGSGDSWSWKWKEASSTSWRIRKTWQVNRVKMCPKQLLENASEILELASSLEGNKAPIATKRTR